MNAFKRASLGYLSGLLVIGGAAALIGCGGAGDDASGRAASHPGATDPGAAGDMNASSGGSSANGSGGSSSKATGGSAGDGASTGGSSSKSGSSGGASGKAGSSSSAGSAGSAGTTAVVHKPSNEAYGTDAFSKKTKPARCQATTLKDGTVVPARDPDCSLQPMMTAELTLSPRDEISLLAPAKAGGFGLTLDDAQTGFQTITASPAENLNDVTLVDTTSGNLDDDGNIELVAAGFKSDGTLVIRVEDSETDPGDQAKRKDQLFTGASELTVTDALDSTMQYQQAAVHVGDVDQDGRDEILVTARTKDGHVVARIYDDAVAGLKDIAQPYYAKGKSIAGVFGNFDSDPAPELAILVDTGESSADGKNIELHLLDDQEHAFAPLATLTGVDTGLIRGANLTANNVELAVGNFDDDPQDELVALADGYDSGTSTVDAIEPALFMVVLDNDLSGSAPVFGALKSTQRELPMPHQNSSSAGYPNQSTPGWRALVADTRAQVAIESAKAAGKLSPKFDEVFVLESVEPANQGSGYDIVLHHETFGSTAWATGSEVQTIAMNHPSPAFSLTAAAGNLTNLASDVIVAVRNGTTLVPTRVMSQPSTSSGVVTYTLGAINLSARTVSDEALGVFATAGDYDADAMRVRYTGNRHQELMNPEPIVVMAAPPVNDQINQDSASSSTHYGESSSQQEDETTEYAVTDTLTFSTDISPPIIGDFVGVTASYSLAQTFTTSQTTTSVTTYTESTDITYPYEGVVFNGTLCEVYEYEIISAGDSSALSAKININEPIATKSFAWTVDHYNQVLASSAGGNKALPIDSKILTHTVGDPASYPSAPQASKTSWVSGLVSVGDFGVLRGKEIDLEKDQSHSVSDTDSSSAGGGSTGLVGIQYTQGWDSTGTYSWTTGKSLSYAGSVGGIAPEDQEYSYSFGLWVHNAPLGSGEVQVVDYYSDAATLPAYGGH